MIEPEDDIVTRIQGFMLDVLGIECYVMAIESPNDEGPYILRSGNDIWCLGAASILATRIEDDASTNIGPLRETDTDDDLFSPENN